MEQAIKTAFPLHRVFDYSSKNDKAIPIILSMCVSDPKIIVYIRKNINNQQYFNLLDQSESTRQFADPRPILELVINSDNYVGFRDDSIDITSKIRDIGKNLIDNDECTICMSKQDHTLPMHICSHCSNRICMNCLGELVKSQIFNGKGQKDHDTGIIHFECPSCKKSIDIKLR